MLSPPPFIDAGGAEGSWGGGGASYAPPASAAGPSKIVPSGAPAASAAARLPLVGRRRRGLMTFLPARTRVRRGVDLCAAWRFALPLRGSTGERFRDDGRVLLRGHRARGLGCALLLAADGRHGGSPRRHSRPWSGAVGHLVRRTRRTWRGVRRGPRPSVPGARTSAGNLHARSPSRQRARFACRTGCGVPRGAQRHASAAWKVTRGIIGSAAPEFKWSIHPAQGSPGVTLVPTAIHAGPTRSFDVRRGGLEWPLRPSACSARWSRGLRRDGSRSAPS